MRKLSCEFRGAAVCDVIIPLATPHAACTFLKVRPSDRSRRTKRAPGPFFIAERNRKSGSLQVK